MRRPRRRCPDQLADVTARCNRSEYRFLPTKERTNALGFWLAKALNMYRGIRLLAVCAMGNHIHLVVHDRDGQLSSFAQYFLGHAAKRINKLDRVRGAVFERRFSEIVILDRDALVKRIAYVITNAVEANLVESHIEWTGLCLFARKERGVHRFTIFHEDLYRQALKDSLRAGADVNRSDFFESAELEIPALDEALAIEVKAAIEDREHMLRSKQSSVVGMSRVLRRSPFDRPRMSARSKMPLCFASTQRIRHAFADRWHAFMAAFREASAAFRAGALDTVFPQFSFRPITSTA